MIGSAPDSARRKPNHGSANDEVRHGDTVVKNTKTSADAFTEKRKKKEHLGSGSASHTKDRDIRNGDQRIQKRRVPGALSEKGRENDDLNKTNSKKKMMGVDLNKKKKIISNDYNKKKVNTASLEKERKKKLLNASTGKHMQMGDGEEGRIMSNSDSKVKSKKVSTTLPEKEKNKEKLNKTHREKNVQAADSKMRNYDSGVKKVQAADSNVRNYDSGVNKGKVSTAFCDKERKRKRTNSTNSEKETAPITSAVKKKKMRTTESMEIKMRHDRQHRRNAPLDVSNEKMDTSSDYCKIGKRKLPHTQSKKQKRMQRNDSDKKIHGAKVKEVEICSCGKEKVNQASLAFFKVLCNNNFEKFLVIPLTAAPRLEHLTNQLVYLKDSGGKCSEVMVSKVAGSLAFHQGWDMFVSNHLIKWGEFLLFEYIAESTFSVRVFGTDSCERLDFKAESTTKGERKKQTWSNMSPDDVVFNDGSSENIDDGNFVSDENPRSKVPQTGHVTYSTKKDPKPVEHVVGSGLVAQDNSGNLIDIQCKTKVTSPLYSKGKRVIEIIDSEDSEPSVHENEDTMKLATSGADSDTGLVAVNTNGYPIRAQRGIGNGPSVVLDDEKGSFPETECGTKCTPTTCREGKTRSQIIITATALLDLHDSDEDLGRIQRTNDIPLDYIAPVVDHHNHSKTNIIQNFYTKYEAPGGFRCLEKWRKDVVNNHAAVDCTAPIKHENPQKNDSMLVDGYGSIELNPVDEYICSEGYHECVQPIFTMPIKEPSNADKVTNCGHDGTENDYSINEKDKGASVLLGAKGEQLEPMRSIVPSRSDNVPLCANPVVPDKNSAEGLTPIGSEGGCGFIEPMFTGPIEKTSILDEIFICRSSMIEIGHNFNGKGAYVLLGEKGEQLEPTRSTVPSQSDNVPLCAYPVVLDKYGAQGLTHIGSEGGCDFIEPMFTGPIEKISIPDEISKCRSSMIEIKHNVNGKGTSVLFETKMDQVEPVRSSVLSKSCNNVLSANESEHCSSKQEGRMSSNCEVPNSLLAMKDGILELDNHSPPEINSQLCIPDTTQKWLDLSMSLSSAVRQRRHRWSVIMLKDPMKRLWPIIYHDNPIFVGFTAGWKHFVAANNLQIGDICELIKESSDVDEPVYSVRMRGKI